MVKKPKSPEPVEDSKLLTVSHPFPANANMEVLSDFKEFMYWLASIIGKDNALGVYHKPSVRTDHYLKNLNGSFVQRRGEWLLQKSARHFKTLTSC
jgi:hypothetical protein